MPESSKPSLLDQLREKSEALRAAEEAARRPRETAQQEISRRLWQAFQWLDEAVRYLGVIHPTVTRSFQLSDALSIDRPKFEQGYVVFRRQGLQDSGLLEYVALQYRLAGAEPVVVRVGVNAASAMDERLRSSMLKFHYQVEQDIQGVARYGVFRVLPTISASILLRPDYSRQVVNVSLQNVDRFDSVVLEFPPDALGESALEDLVRCVLGESDRFLHLAPVALARPKRGEAQDRPRRDDSNPPMDVPSRFGDAYASHAATLKPDPRTQRRSGSRREDDS